MNKKKENTDLGEREMIDERISLKNRFLYWWRVGIYRKMRSKLDMMSISNDRLKLRIIADRNFIKTDYIDILKDDKRIWINNRYANGNIYVSNKANPVIVNAKTGETITTKQYKELVDNSIWNKIVAAINEQFQEKSDFTTYLLIGVLILQVIMLFAIGGK